MKKYDVLLFDVDGTLLDFDRAEEMGIEGLLEHYGVPVTAENKEKYHHLNKSYWERLRFEEFFGDFGISVDGMDTDRLYREYLNEGAFLIDGARELLEGLKGQYELYIITNGVAATQYHRLGKSGLDRYFKDIFISEEAGSQKPQPEYFEYCFQKMGRRDVENMLVIGDSLTSDIKGGNTLWFNPHRQENTKGVHVEYEADSLEKIGKMLI